MAAGRASLHPGMVSDSGEGWREQLTILGGQPGGEGASLTVKTRGDMHGGGGREPLLALVLSWLWHHLHYIKE